MKKANLEECRDMLMKSSEEKVAPEWKPFFIGWLNDNGWTYKEFEKALQDLYNSVSDV